MEIILGQPYSFCLTGQRDNQEDSRYPDSDAPQPYAPFFLVCDGVGGCQKGEVASHTVCDAFGRTLSARDWHQPFDNVDFQRVLQKAYQELRRKENPSSRGMATTLTFAAFHSGGCTVAHIGDSRIYHIRPQHGILYRSDDHSLVNALVHSGNLTPDEAIGHPDSNIITRYMGIPIGNEPVAKATVMLLDDLQAGDYILLCSDGVLHCMSDRELYDLLSSNLTDEDKIRQMEQACNDSPDNSTAYLIPIEGVNNQNTFIDENGAQDHTRPTTQPILREPEHVHNLSPYDYGSLFSRVKTAIDRLFK